MIDGVDISPALLSTGPSPRQTMFFYRGTKLHAVRHGLFKAHFITKPAYGPGRAEEHDPPELYNLDEDPSERFNVAAKRADVIAEIRKIVEAHRKTVVPVESQFEKVTARR